MKQLITTFFSVIAVLSLLFSCKSGNAHYSLSRGDTIPMTYAVNLTMVDFDGYTKVDIRNPWDTTRLLHSYILVPDSGVVPENMSGSTIIRTPVKNAVVYTAVHNRLAAEFGVAGSITGLCDASYIHDPEIVSRLAAGKIVDCGSSMAPDVERIIGLKPDAVLLSPYENTNGYGKLSQLGVPIVECADYMEASPLGRAEWMKFYGRLFGVAESADSLFADTERSYLEMKSVAEGAGNRPGVLLDRIYGGAWYVPGAYSTMGRFIEDAGGRNIFSDYKIAGSAALAPEQVLYRGGDADLWLIRYAQSVDMTMPQLANDNALYGKLKPFKSGSVYGCNTAVNDFYEEMPFHPQWLLGELVALIHPELVADTVPARYFKKLKP
ncbi:MAG: ABC transporter substrate-binding protein [Bacteroides sp.]|nr:ABC transporter substrate-binding protein [Bacteroides sp.]